MGKITLLNQALTNMIAAGEVIERPSSVIKELVENSLDAKATVIDIVVHAAGRTKIVVGDNGEGMDRDDAVLAFKRHATSKIRDEFDLFRIKTLGFRGEALPSIAAVSRVWLRTSTGQGIGTSLHAYEDNLEYDDAPLKPGTIIEVEELFYNTPARLKYLKNDQIENASNLETAARLALAHPDVAFSFSIDDREQFHTSGRGDQLETIFSIYGANVAKNVIPVAFARPDFSISGYLGKPDIARSNRYYMAIFLNGRNVYMGKIQASLIEAYRDFLPPSRFPFVVLNLKIEPVLVDVNVHPSKREVRFSKENELRETLLKIIPAALKNTSLIAKPLAEKISYETQETSAAGAPLILAEPEAATPIVTEAEPILGKTQAYEVIGQLHQTFILAETGTGALIIIDQHAAAERINYEKYQALALTGNHVSEPLVPLIIDLKPSDAILLTEAKLALLKDTGLLIEPFGAHEFRVVHLPVWACESDETTYVQSLVDQVIHEEGLDVLKLRDEAIASKSCKRSLKANQTLSLSEMRRLVDDLLKTSNPYSCPHGRPTIIEFSLYELEKMFKRTGF